MDEGQTEVVEQLTQVVDRGSIQEVRDSLRQLQQISTFQVWRGCDVEGVDLRQGVDQQLKC